MELVPAGAEAGSAWVVVAAAAAVALAVSEEVAVVEGGALAEKTAAAGTAAFVDEGTVVGTADEEIVVHADEEIVAAEEEGLVGIGHAEIAVAADFGEIAGETAGEEIAAALADVKVVDIAHEEIAASENEAVAVGSEAAVELMADADARSAVGVFDGVFAAVAAGIEDMDMASSPGDSLALWRSHCRSHCTSTVPAPEEGHCCTVSAEGRCLAGTGEGCTADTVPS